MRKTPYMVSLVAVLVSLTMSLISISIPFLLRSQISAGTVLTVDYGYSSRCEKIIIQLPYPYPTDPEPTKNTTTLVKYKCYPFPARSTCERDGESFCILWATAGYSAEFSTVFAFASLFTIAIANISTKARRRTAWKIISALVALQGILQITSTTLVAYILQTFPANFALGTRYGISFWLNILSWFLDLAIVTGLIVTGVYARKGHRWAAGRRPYTPIPG